MAIAIWMLLFSLLARVTGAAQSESDELAREHRRLVAAVAEYEPSTPYVVINTQDNLLLLHDANRVLKKG